MQVSLKLLVAQVAEINYLLNRTIPTIKICKKSEGLKIRVIKTSRNLFPEAATKKNLFLCLESFKTGLQYSIDQ